MNERGGECLQRMEGQLGKVFDGIVQAVSAKACQCLKASAKADRLGSLLRLPQSPPNSASQLLLEGFPWEHRTNVAVSQVPGYQSVAMHSFNNTVFKKWLPWKETRKPGGGNLGKPQLPRAPFFAEGSSPHEARAPWNITPSAFPCQGAHYKGQCGVAQTVLCNHPLCSARGRGD